MIKRYSSDQSKLNFGQRFRLTSLAQKYAVYSHLWRRKLQEKEEGRSLNGTHKKPVEIPMEERPCAWSARIPMRKRKKLSSFWRLCRRPKGR